MKRVYDGESRFAKRSSYSVNQAYNILDYFGKPAVKAWAEGDPNGSAVASQLADIDFDGSVAKALRESIGYQAKARFNANRKRASLTSTQFDRMVDYIDEVYGMNFYAYGGSLSDVRRLISDVLYNELLIDVSPDDPLVDDFINEWNMFFAGPNKLAQRNPRRANRRVAGVTKQDLQGIAIKAMDMGGGWEFYVIRHDQGGFEWYLFTPWGELETVRLTDSINRAVEVAERVIGNRIRSLSVTDEEREQMKRDNEEYLRGLKGGSRRANRKNAMDHTHLDQKNFVTLAKLYAEEIFSTTDAKVLVDWLHNDRDNSVGDDINTFSTLPAETYHVEFYLEELIRENLPHERMGNSHRANRKGARDWGDTIDELLWHFDALYGEVGDESIRDFLWGSDSFGLQYEFDAFMKSAPPSVRERAMSRVKTMFKFLKTSHRANRRTSSDLNDVAGDYALEVFSSVDDGLLVDWFYGVNVPEVDNAVAEWTTDYDMVELVHDHIEYLIMTKLPYESIRVERVSR